MKISAVEALLNALVGMFVSWAVTYYALPLWGLTPSAPQAAGITAFFFVVSFARAWALRELFRRFDI